MVFSISKWRRRSIVGKTDSTSAQFQHRDSETSHANTQSALLLHAVRQPYELTADRPIPSILHDNELLVKVIAIGLNPIDWKAPDFNFGIPTLPYIAGREFTGTVVQVPESLKSRIRKGDVVIVPSTDYRDLRKAAFQEYSIASSFNTIRLPQNISPQSGSILGVAFVAAALALGICMGVGFEDIEGGPDLLKVVKSIKPERLPADIRKECLEGIKDDERAQKGDFVVIWGGSSTCAHTMKQLARLAGLKIISVVDSGKHGLRLSSHDHIRPDLLVDAHDPERAINVIRSATKGTARFGFDTQGKDTAAHLVRSLASTKSFPQQPEEYSTSKSDSKLPTPPSTPAEANSSPPCSHLVGLTGLPKTNVPEDVALHSVPIKLFHEIPEVGEALCSWAERLLVKKRLVPPDVLGMVEGLESINEGLNRLRKREVSGGRLVAVLQ